MSENTSSSPATSGELDVAGAFNESPTKRKCFGKFWIVRYLDLNDLILMQRMVGGNLEKIDTGSLEHMRFFLWLCLRKSQDGLTEDDLDNERYTLTEKQVGRMLNLKTLKEQETTDFIRDLLIGSGLAEDPNEEADSKNEPEAGK